MENKGLKTVAQYSIIKKTDVDIIFLIFRLKMKGVNMMTEKFGVLPTGEEATLYTISCGKLTAGGRGAGLR